MDKNTLISNLEKQISILKWAIEDAKTSRKKQLYYYKKDNNIFERLNNQKGSFIWTNSNGRGEVSLTEEQLIKNKAEKLYYGC